MDDITLFLGTEGSHNRNRIAIVGESWGTEEAKAQRPFIGQSGQELTRMLADAGINRHECFLTNVCSRRPPDNEMRYFFNSTKAARSGGEIPLRGLYPDPQTRLDLERLHRQLAAVQPRVIIAFGNWALWALTQNCFSVKDEKGWKAPVGIGNWRGSYLEWNTWDAPGEGPMPEAFIPVIPTFHPAAIMRSWPWRTPAVHDLRARVAPLAKGFSVPEPDYRFLLRPSFQEALNALDHILALPAGSLITADTETRGDQIACLGIAWSAKDAVCIPFGAVDPQRKDQPMEALHPGSYWSTAEEVTIRERVAAALAGDRLRVSNQNINFDRQYWYRYFFVKTKAAFDTMLAHHLCWPGTPKGLAYLSSLYCRYHRFWKDDGRNWTIDQDEAVLWEYCCKDCCSTWEITNVLEQLIKTLGFQPQFRERMDMLDIAFDMMIEGVAIDSAERSRQIMDVMNKQSLIQSYLERLMPGEYRELIRGKTSKSEWYSSPAQLGTFLYDLLGCKEIIKKKTGQRTVDDDALLRIAASYPLLQQLIEPIQNLRSLGVILSNFLSAKLDFDGRMRCTFDPTGTETLRWSSYESAFWSGTNLQNIPKEQSE